jgi:hypothetical protein
MNVETLVDESVRWADLQTMPTPQWDLINFKQFASMNFSPAMNRSALLEGFRYVLQNIYRPKHYYERVRGSV